MLTRSALSTEYIRVRIRAKEAGVDQDLSGLTVKMAFIAPGSSPGASDWKTATWDTDSTVDPDAYYAQCLVGPNGGVITLTAQEWNVWSKVTDTPEEVIQNHGPMRIT